MAEEARHTANRYQRLRLVTLTGALLLVAVNPFVSFYLHNTFIQGWYQSLGIGELWFVSPLEGLESLLVTRTLYLPALIGMLPPLILALLLGRVFCSWLCPISWCTEILDRLRRRISRKQHLRNRLVLARQVLWFTLITELLLSMIVGAPLFVFLSPPGLVGREIMMAVFFHSLAIEGIIIVIVLALELVTRRFYCRSLCPLGALLALIGTRRKLVVQQDAGSCIGCGRCDLACPMGIRPSRGESTSSYCWNCGCCVDACRESSLNYIWRSGSG